MNTTLKTNGVLFEPGPEWSGYTTDKHLAAARMINPKWASDVMTYIGTVNNSHMAYEEYLKLIGNVVYEDDDRPINMMVYGEGRKYATLVRYEADDRNRVGLNKSEFKMVFDSPLFSDVHTIVGLNDRYKIRLISDSTEVQGGWMYIAKYFGPANKFIPASELVSGSTWTKEGAAVSMTDSMKGAKTSYSSPYAITFDWSAVSIQDDVPGNMKHRPVAFGWQEGSGKYNWTWEDYRTYKNDIEFRDLKAKTLVWGKSNRNADGGIDDIDERSNVEITEGSGIVQQIERGNLHKYSKFDIDEFSQHILDLRVGKTSSDITKYIVSTGTNGLMQAAKAISEKAQGWQIVDSKSIFGGDTMNLAFGNSFRRYIHPAGFEIDFRLEPMLDDDSRTRIKHPNGGYMRSYEYHVMDLGQTQGVNNITLHYTKTAADIAVIVPGMRDPFSPTGISKTFRPAASTKDAWSERRMSQFMVTIQNPKNTMIYRPNLYY